MPKLSVPLSKRWQNRRTGWWWATLAIVIPVVGSTAVAAWILPLLVNPTTSSDELEVLRITLTVGAGAGGIVALILAVRRQWSTEQTNKANEQDSVERRITELYTKAVDQLGSEQAAVRLGGLYALERLAITTPTQQATISNVICAYLRMPYTNPPLSKSEPSEVDRKEHNRLVQEQEIRQTALDILIRRDSQERGAFWRTQRIHLQRANLTEAGMHKANLTGAYLNDANLTEADLTGANLNRANLTAANLTGTYLNAADMIRADLPGALLIGADLTNANLTMADLNGVNLNGADLSGANLTGADLTGANLTDANLTETNLTKTDLSGTKLYGAKLTDADLSGADLTDAVLTNADLTNAVLTDANLTDAQRDAAM
jgi:hypothetical protein